MLTTSNSKFINKGLISKIINGSTKCLSRSTEYITKLDKYFSELENEKDKKKITELYFNIGLMYFLLCKYSLAEKFFYRAFVFEPRLVFYLIGITNYYMAQQKIIFKTTRSRKNNYNKAIENLEKAINIKSRTISDFQIYYELCNISYEMKDFLKVSSIIESITDTERTLN